MRQGRSRRGQGKLESMVALVLLAIAFLGAWKLYGPDIKHTTGVMVESFLGSEESAE